MGMAELRIKLTFAPNSPAVFGISHPYEWAIDVTAELNPRVDHGTTRIATPVGPYIDATTATCEHSRKDKQTMFWPTYANGTPILAGDWVRVYVPRLGVWHHGIIQLLYWTHSGIAVQIVHNDKSNGVSSVDWHDFADGNMILLHKRPCEQHAPVVVARANANIGKPYHLFAQNCEHFAAFAFTGEAKSESMRALGTIAAALLVIGFLGAD